MIEGARRFAREIRKRRRFRLRRLSWIGAAAAVALAAPNLFGVDLIHLQLSATPLDVHLERPGSTISTPDVVLTGTTRPAATITTVVDGSKQPYAFADDLTGAFTLSIHIPEIGIHRIRIEAAYGPPGQPNEVAELSLVRTPERLPQPEVLGAQGTTDPNDFWVLIGGTPRTRVVANAGSILSKSVIGDNGRVQVEVRLDGSGSLVRFAVRDVHESSSDFSDPIDLAALAAQKPGTSSVDAHWTIDYLVTRASVTRTQTVTTRKDRPEVADLTRGAIDARTFVDRVAGSAGLAPVGNFGCLVNSLGDDHSELEIGDDAVVTLTDEFPDLLASWNGLSSKPQLSLCFPTGFPGIRNDGTLELTVEDYSIRAVTGAVDSSSHVALADGTTQRTMVWKSVPRNGAIDISLSLDTASALAALPALRPQSLFRNEGFGPVLLALADSAIHAAGVLLLLWAVCSRAARQVMTESAGRKRRIVGDDVRAALANVLTLGAGLLFLPAYGGISGVGVPFASSFQSVQDAASQLNLQPSLLSRWLIAFVIAAAAFGSAWLLKRLDMEFRARVAAAIGIGSGAWMAISLAAWLSSTVVLTLTSDDLDADRASRIATWLLGAATLTVIVALLSRWFGVFLGRRNRLAVTRGHLHRLGWALVGGLILAVPAGTEQPITTSPDYLPGYIEASVSGLMGLIAFSLPLVAVAGVAGMVRAAWSTTAWEQIVAIPPGESHSPDSRSSRLAQTGWLAPQLARGLFAGFVIGTAGVLLPVPFVLAFLLFWLLLRPTSEVLALAGYASRLRNERGWMIEAKLGNPTASDRLELLGGEVPAEATELAPGASVWASVRLALGAAAALELPLLVIYLWRYPFASISPQDPYYIQRLFFNAATFIGTWLTIAVVFALLYEHLRGNTGVRKGLWYGLAILALTVPWQVASGFATALSPVAIGIHVFEVVTFTGLIGAIFDLKLLREAGTATLGHPRELLRQLGDVSGLPDLAASVGLLLTAVVTTVVSLLTGQVTQLLTRVLSPFLPLPPDGG